ncbi:MAG: hypothetical protein V4570_01030 [Pseudomonadota bacterium]
MPIILGAKLLPVRRVGSKGWKGTPFGKPYEAGSWQDKLIEAFSGTHDFVGGKLIGLHDE